MPWARFDERFPGHRKVRRLSDAAFRLHVSAICWSCEYLTDGVISPDDLAEASEVRRPRQAADELVKSGRWHLPDHDCTSENCGPFKDGWLIHDFLDYNPSREEVEAKREKDADRKRRGRQSESRRSPRGHTADSNGTPNGSHSESDERPSVPNPVVTNVTTNPARTDPVERATPSADNAQPIVDAYVRGAREAGLPDPDGSLCARVGKQAKGMLAAHDPVALARAAFNMGANGWHDLAVQVQRDAASARGQPNKASQRTEANLAVVARLAEQERGA